MLSPKDLVILRHMLDAARKAIEFSHGRSRAELDTDEILALALVRLLEITGEAAKKVSSDLRQQYTRIPWKEIAGTRDRLIHGYFDVDLDIIWSIITNDLPFLVKELGGLVETDSED